MHNAFNHPRFDYCDLMCGSIYKSHFMEKLIACHSALFMLEKLQKPEWDNSLIVYPTEEVENKQEKWSEINSNSYTVPCESGNNNENDLNFEFDDNSYTSCEINENHLDRYSSTESIDSNCADYCLNIASTDSFDLDNNRTFFGQSRNPSFDASKPRSIVEIRESLELKVKRLREEKTEVDEKIRLAQEEDVIRSQEKVKFQQQLSIHRKERLRRVIGELKKKLEDQSQRLQTGYNSIILLKRNVTRSRSFVKKNRMQREDSKEAPF
ncbi:uncharacterized protein LOC144343717 [Saccoglossus kowalevskii]